MAQAFIEAALLPHPSEWDKNTLSSLEAEGRIPMVILWETPEIEVVTLKCFVPGGETEPGQTFALSPDDARHIEDIRYELQHPDSHIRPIPSPD